MQGIRRTPDTACKTATIALIPEDEHADDDRRDDADLIEDEVLSDHIEDGCYDDRLEERLENSRKFGPSVTTVDDQINDERRFARLCIHRPVAYPQQHRYQWLKYESKAHRPDETRYDPFG